MAANPTRRKILKIFGIIIGVLIVLLISFHFWFKAHAKQMLEDLVETKSNGNLKMKVKNFKFGYFSKNMELDNVLFYNTDTVNENTSYRLNVQKIKLKAKGLLAIIFKNQFLIDSLTLYEPAIEVTRLNLSLNKNGAKKDVSIPEEMGKIYKSIQNALNVLKVSRFRIESGKFTLINKIQTDFRPIKIGNLNFQIINFLIDTGNVINKEKILFSDNVILSSNDQDIILPDSRHRISYKYFNINLKKRLVEFDSCTIAATATDSSNSSFNVFFDKLLMTNIDFDTLYKAEVIKADSVYCVNPQFNLKVEVSKKKQTNKNPLKLENIIKQLTGNLILAHVVVSNADFNIETIKNGVPSSFTFTKNNFEMQGLKIDQGAESPIKVDRFAMAIRNYENFIKDSSYSIKFDSILFKDDRIALSNFLFEKLNNGKRINSFRIPQFYLGGLSWDDLVFENKLKADQATMFYPNIIYTVNQDKRKSGQQNIFQALGAVNELMDLNYLEVIDGNIDLTIKKDLKLKLKRANLSIESNSLLSSKKIATIKNSLTAINFEKGKLEIGNLEIELHKLRYVGENGHFAAETITLKDKNKHYYFLIKNVDVDKMIVDELNGNIDATGISWKKGTIDIDLHKYKKESTQSIILLEKINGENTLINLIKDDLTISTDIKKINLDRMESQPDKPIILEGLKIIGSDLKINNKSTNISINDYQITDNETSTFHNIDFTSNTPKSAINFATTSLSFIPNVQSLLKNNYYFENVLIEKPLLKLQLNEVASAKKSILPGIKINSLKINQPVLDFHFNDSSNTSFNWNGTLNPSAYLEIKDLDINSIKSGFTTIAEARFNMSDFVFMSKGKNFSSKNGNIVTTIKNIELKSAEKQIVNWKAYISNLKANNFSADSIGEKKGKLVINSGELYNLDIHSGIVSSVKKILNNNTEFRLNNLYGNYKDPEHVIFWSNAAFNRSKNRFTLDSFSYNPALSIDSFLAKQSFQKEYLTFTTESIEINDVNPELFLNEDLLKASSIKIHNPIFTDYLDKQFPFNPGIIKPLPANLVKKIPFYVLIKNIEIENGNLVYTESGLQPNSAGIIPIKSLSIKVRNIRNFDLQPNDTLEIDATGFLLDSVLTHLNIKESYNDKNGGFLLKFQVSPVDLTIINPVLIPLSSVKLESGFLDSLDATIIGRETVATGEMKMFYHDLKIRLPNKLKTFIANTFIIKKNNNSRTGQVFFIRNRDRSFINYYVKIIGSGVASSIGAKNNKKLKRRYEKKLKKNITH